MAAVLRRLRRARVLAGLAAAAMTVILAAVTAGCSSATHSGTAARGSLQSSYEATITRALPSVVEIIAGGTTGSGVVFDHHGDVVTNAHVVGGKKSFEVRSSVVSQTMRAKLVGVFAPDDLAVIKVGKGASQLRPVRWANSDKAQVGQIVLAMGSPYGLTDSVTQGIVSATGRTVHGPELQGRVASVIVNALQTSAAINPGNSGGALVLLTGRVLGIPTLAATDPDLGRPVDGIGFAIPSNTVVAIARQLIAKGKVTRSDRASLDIEGETHVNAEHVPDGVAVTQVTPAGAAAKAGIRTGDVIAGIQGQPTPDVETLDNVLTAFRPGEQVNVEVLRGGNPRQVKVRLGSLVSPPPGARGKPGAKASPAATRSPARHNGSPHPSRG
jgi:putative serine protease PepD